MPSNREVARAFAHRGKAKSRTMFIDGRTVYSYGRHFPIAHRRKNGTIIFNKQKFSPTTSHHQSLVKQELSETFPKEKIEIGTTESIIMEMEEE